MPHDPDAWALIPGDFLRGDKFLGAMQKVDVSTLAIGKLASLQ